jgi:hypothetical protein
MLLLLLERLPDGEGKQVAPDGAGLRTDGGQPAAQVPKVQMLQDEEDDGETDPAAQQHEGGHELGQGQGLAGGPLTLARLARPLGRGAVTNASHEISLSFLFIFAVQNLPKHSR